MTTMALTFSDDNGVMTFEMGADDSRVSARTTLQDTAHGVEVKTVLTATDGTQRTVMDKLDRGTPPLQIMMSVFEQYETSFLHNAQAAFNRSRYNRLVAEDLPITMQNMCMDGAHTGPEYADVPFEGGIVGVADLPQDAPKPEPKSDLTEEQQDKLRAMLDWLPQEGEEAA